MTAWTHLWVATRRKDYWVSRAPHHWRAVVLLELSLRLRASESKLREDEDEHVMTAPQNADLQFALQTLQAELTEETLRLKNSGGTSAKLQKRLEVSSECIRSMRKDYAMTCNHCNKTLMQMHQTERTETKNALCSFVADENFDDESTDEAVVEFANVQLKEMMRNDVAKW
ncbi:hypothetical protein CYMTET_23278 [Cymbomonas tetramitiformis]|uniref:Uncharacterized protein n=1 Tax=Cymbomonas tetramitiformis TaxID=36881 RepID=A0AAE0FY96_9CHLO|nr:hypothetical protein CYMTET_23278 [Cymbomonas tetramitiformis]|eukprot:gene28969-35993_t